MNKAHKVPTKRPIGPRDADRLLEKASRQYDEYLRLTQVARLAAGARHVEPVANSDESPLSLVLWPTK